MRGWKSVLSSAPTQDKDLFETTHNSQTQSLSSNHPRFSHSHTLTHTQLTERFPPHSSGAPEEAGKCQTAIATAARCDNG